MYRKMALDSRNFKKYNPHEQTLKISEIKSICKLHKILVHESFEEVFDGQCMILANISNRRWMFQKVSSFSIEMNIQAKRI
jgi:hypothetical protein